MQIFLNFIVNRIKWVKYSFPIIFLLILSIPVSADSDKRAAIIESINGPASVFMVKRGSQEITTIYPLMPLQDGDLLSVTKPENNILKNTQNFVTLKFGDNLSITVTYENSPYLVKIRKTARTVPGGIFTEIGSQFAKLFRHYVQAELAITKSFEPFSIPLLPTRETQRLKTGKRALHLAWRGGIAPYQVQVYWNKGKLLEKSNITEKRVRFNTLRLITGYYRVEIRDKTGYKIEGKFQVINNSPPNLSKQDALEMEQSTMPKLAKDTLRVAWLARQDDGMWRLEAYQHIFELAKQNYQPALVLREGLEAGIND